MNFWPSFKENPAMAIALLALIVLGVVYLGVKTDNTYRQSQEVGKPVPYEHSIYIEGEGRVSGTPDVAKLTLTVQSKGADVPTAQEANTTTTNALIEKLKGMEIAKEDIQTSSYNVYEDWQWNEEQQTSISVGWIVEQTLTVKVRDTEDKVGEVLAMVGSNGITYVYGPEWIVDDNSGLKDEAREEAIADAQKKADLLAAKLGLELDGIIGYSEWVEQPYMDPYYGGYYAAEYGGKAPDIEAGQSELVLHASITYKLAE